MYQRLVEEFRAHETQRSAKSTRTRIRDDIEPDQDHFWEKAESLRRRILQRNESSIKRRTVTTNQCGFQQAKYLKVFGSWWSWQPASSGIAGWQLCKCRVGSGKSSNYREQFSRAYFCYLILLLLNQVTNRRINLLARNSVNAPYKSQP